MISVVVNILIVVLILGFLITIHELGHFMAAKLFKVKVEAFAIGLGPKIFGKKIGETEYRLNVFPLGGYVKILGEGDEERDKKEEKDPGNFKNKSKIAQVIILLAGITMNLVFALVIYYGFIISFSYKWALGEDIRDFEPVVGTVEVEKVGKVKYDGLVEESGADKAGLPKNGEIMRVDGKELVYSYEFRDYVSKRPNENVIIDICNTECKDYSVNISKEGKAGIYVASNYIIFLDYSRDKVISGVGHALNLFKLMGEKLGSLFSEAKQTGDYSPIANNISGPIGIYLIVEAFKQYGFLSLLGLTADLSFTLMIMNILPIPALDGGRVMLIILESIFGKYWNRKVEIWAINISFVFLLLLMVAIVFKDIIFFDDIRKLLR
ncbi:MAG: Membrane metalloprotease [candidate division WS6 bacterium GW2011_GWF2_39_15]|uniref:Membrane metalloprotease n=1 Tax=candidate division WS6 bacterium GW2011_GWF2_39_15 TaxID=1619100 RepID=A0A0G0N0J2_9BACT|nr:MAG: Membrane metalloprotease [candidate division WS6 bacterium GW2011_GWF2_39_15]